MTGLPSFSWYAVSQLMSSGHCYPYQPRSLFGTTRTNAFRNKHALCAALRWQRRVRDSSVRLYLQVITYGSAFRVNVFGQSLWHLYRSFLLPIPRIRTIVLTGRAHWFLGINPSDPLRLWHLFLLSSLHCNTGKYSLEPSSHADALRACAVSTKNTN